jgi:hypothetical protein
LNESLPDANEIHPVALQENSDCALQGPTKGAPFEIDSADAHAWLTKHPNPHGRPNSDVLLPWLNGASVTGKWTGQWIIDFSGLDEEAASCYEAPFARVVRDVKPLKLAQARESRRQRWWLFNEPAPKVRAASRSLTRLLVTPEVAKHRVWKWLPTPACADKNLVVIVRDDDTTFGLMHSRIHEVWALRHGTSLEDRPRYTSTTTFRTFPFPLGLTPADTAHQQTEAASDGALIPADLPAATRPLAEAIARAAKRLDDLRERWLNPPEWCERVPEVVPLGMERSPYPDRIVAKPGHDKELAKRTLTNLYNERPAWLVKAHADLDAAVAAAYGWTDGATLTDDEILRRLLALNRERAAKT